MNGAQALIESLKRENVEHMFGYAGATICPAVDALKEHPEIYADLATKGEKLACGLRAAAEEAGVPVAINQIGSLLAPFFTPTEVTTFTDAKGSDVGRYAKYFQGMLEHGVALAPAQFEAMFLSDAHSGEDLTATLEAFQQTLEALSH